MIKVENIDKAFDDNHVLNDISVVFEPGKTNVIIGTSGSGKTVFMKCLIGLYEVDSGSIFYHDVEFSHLNNKERKKIRKQIGMLFQGNALFDSMNVKDNIIFPLNMFTKLSDREKLERVNFCLDRVNLSGAGNLFPAELSGGMKKRVGIARAIVQNPKYLFCDEPNSGLDPQSAIVIDNLIKEITEEYNITTVVNTHDMNSVMEIGDHIIYLNEGEKWWEGSNVEVLTSDNPELQSFIFASDFIKQAIINPDNPDESDDNKPK